MKMTLVLFGTFYVAMVGAGYLSKSSSAATGLIPEHRMAMVMAAGISWNYTTWLNIAFLILAARLVIRFLRTGRGLDAADDGRRSWLRQRRPRSPLTSAADTSGCRGCP